MEFKVALEDLEPSELRYYKVMQPLWNRLEERLDELVDVDWQMRETRGPTNLIGGAELENPKVDWIEIRGEQAERLDDGQDDDYLRVRLSKWFGVVMFKEGSTPEGVDEMKRTDARENIADAVDGLTDILDKSDVTLE